MCIYGPARHPATPPNAIPPQPPQQPPTGMASAGLVPPLHYTTGYLHAVFTTVFF